MVTINSFGGELADITADELTDISYIPCFTCVSMCAIKARANALAYAGR